VNDDAYAWRQLQPVLPSVDAATFAEHHRDIMQPQLVSTLRYPGRFRMAALDVKWGLQKTRDGMLGRGRRRPPGSPGAGAGRASSP
jgi:hypothetical protein